MESLNKIPAKLIRGGTSKGLYFHLNHLPSTPTDRDSLILKIMGSPDPSGLQMDGIGGGISSTSKVALISKRLMNGISFLNYFFGQVSIKESKVDWSGNCGNLASGLFEFAKHEKDYEDCFEKVEGNPNYHDKLRVWQENKKHEMYIWGNLNPAAHPPNLVRISGIQRSYPALFVEFKNILAENEDFFPTGNLKDLLKLSETETIEATLLSGTNPLILIRPDVLGLKGHEIPKEINYEAIKGKLDRILAAGAALMKMEATEALRIAWLSKPAAYVDSSGNLIEKDSVDILSRITTKDRVHHAHTGTGAINVAVASLIKGTVANDSLEVLPPGKTNEVRIGHPGGTMICEAEIEYDHLKGKCLIKRAGFVRTARMLLDGFVFWE